MKYLPKLEKKWIAIVALVLIIPIIFVLLSSDHSGKKIEEKVSLKPVRTVTVASQAGGEVIMQAGEIAAAKEAELSFLVGGKVIERNVNVGDVVQAGQVIAIIEANELNNELKVAAADLESTKASSKLAQENAARGARLLASEAIAKAQVDAAQTEARAADEKRKAAEAAYENAKRRVDHATLKATDDGTVTAVSVNAGEVVSPGQPIVKIAQKNGVDAVFDVSEKVFNMAPVDIKVHVSLLSDPKISTEGVVREVSPAADPITRTYKVKIALQNPPEAMAYGATVMGKAILPSASVIKIPASAITSENDRPAVYAVDEKTNELLRLPVTVQSYAEENVYISDGLQNGQRIVVAGVSKLRPGQKVTLEDPKNDK